MTLVLRKADILPLLKDLDLVGAMEEGFIAYSNGNTVVPPVGELLFEEPKGDAHIKYGYIKNDGYYCVKIASGFYDNAALGISSSQGLILLFNQNTGQTLAVLLDDGLLTDVRTAAAGAVAAKYFAPDTIRAIGIIGTGIQAQQQLELLKTQTDCKTVWVWGRNHERALKFKAEFEQQFTVSIANSAREVAAQCNFIVTTTPTEQPLLMSEDIQKGTHITCVGADTADKQELDSHILAIADHVIADSLPQSQSRGEIYKAVQAKTISAESVTELGHAIQDTRLQRGNDEQITVVDLTGVAVQDIMIAKAVYLQALQAKR